MRMPSPTAQKRIALAVVVPSAAVLIVTISLLVRDYARARRNQPLDKAQVEALTQQANEDVSRMAELTAELERQTERSLQRAAQHTIQTRVLIVAAILFLVSAKWLISFSPPIAPTLDTIASVRADEPARSRQRRRWFRRRSSSRTNGDVTSAPPVVEVDLNEVDAIVKRQGSGTEAAIPIIQAIQSHFGYLPDDALRRVCDVTEITPAQISGVSTFYAHFRRSPVGKHLVKVCHGTACHVAGARTITDEIRRRLGIAQNEDTDAERMFTLEEVACVGCCSLAPVIVIDETTVGNLTLVSACGALEAYRSEACV